MPKLYFEKSPVLNWLRIHGGYNARANLARSTSNEKALLRLVKYEGSSYFGGSEGVSPVQKIIFLREDLSIKTLAAATQYAFRGQEVLSKNPKVLELYAVARDPKTAPEELERLAGLGIDKISRGIAENPSAPPEALKVLAAPYSGVHNLVARHPNTPDGSLEHFLGEAWQDLCYPGHNRNRDTGSLAQALKENPRLTKLVSDAAGEKLPEKLAAFAESPIRSVRLAVARSGYSSPETLRILSKDKIFEIRLAVVKNSGAPQDVVEDLYLNDPNEGVRKAAESGPFAAYALGAADRQANDPTYLFKLSLMPFIPLRKKLAANTACFPETLALLAKDKSDEVRRIVALNPATPENILDELVNNDPAEEVRKAVASNPAIEKLVEIARTTANSFSLLYLSYKPFPCVRTEVAKNENTEPWELESLAQREHRWMVLFQVGSNRKTPWPTVAIILGKIRKDSYEVEVGSEWVFDHACHDGVEYRAEPIYATRSAYIGESLEIARSILQQHEADKKLISERLRELNIELYEALIKNKFLP